MIFSTSTRNRLKTSPRIAKMISALSWGVRILDKLFTSKFWASRSLLNIDKSFSPLFWFSSSLLILDNSFSSKVRISSSLLIKDKSFSMEFWFLSSLLFCCGRQCSTFGPQPALRDWSYRQMHWKRHWKANVSRIITKVLWTQSRQKFPFFVPILDWCILTCVQS